ncbi:hypothetical protein [Aequorivita viscosa]|uniref:Uncharacterized protein n=1 Tax=Aequorivita viscosa TaxID=797419 RepID=A0A1M6MG46_9FLAO|nr:hypothetical protein [Aequorivita viscosa]SDX33420.1 hypothetical protein SAMN05216556_12516 [Aequorivita viscosa]SHJ82455.1 hypothetical protein SAMN04487908_12714 [Aequorivita viscosa]
MIELGRITHKNKIIDLKSKVIYDYFHYFLSENEYLSLQNQPLDNHISILQKIDFRLSNTSLELSSQIVIKQLMDNDLFNLKTDIVSRKGKARTIINKIKGNLSSKNIDVLTLKVNVEEAVIVLNGSYDFDNTEYLELCVDNIIFYLSCGCEYSKHKEEIIYFTKLVASEFLRLGFSIKELTGVNGVFNRLLSKEIIIDEKTKNLHSRFPLSLEIERQRGEKHFKKIVEDFLKNRTLKEQFKGIENYVKKDLLEYIFIVRVKNALGFEGLNISYKNIEIVSSAHIIAMGEELGEEQKERLRNFIKPKSCIYFKIPIKHKSFDSAVHLAFKEADNTLSYLSYPKPLRGEIDKSDIIRIYNNNLGWKWKRESLVVSNDLKYDLDNLELNSILNNELTHLDNLYFRAFTSRLIEDKVINAWRYLEILGRYGGFYKDREGIKNLPFILLLSERNYSKLHLENLIINLINNNRDIVKCNIPDSKIYALTDQTNCIETLKNNTNYYFTNELISDFENMDINFKRRYTSYKGILELLYEQRNFIIHQASICSLSANQSLNVIQILLTRMRKTIISDVKENSRNELENSIKHLIREGKNLVD